MRWEEQGEEIRFDVTLNDKHADLLHIIDATRAAQWLLNYKGRIPPLTTLHPGQPPKPTQTSWTVEHTIQRSLWLLNHRVNVSPLRPHPILDLMLAPRPKKPQDDDTLIEVLTPGAPGAPLQERPVAEQHAQQLAARLQEVNTTLRHSGFQARIQHFQRLARKRHQSRVKHLNSLLAANPHLRWVRLDTGYTPYFARPGAPQGIRDATDSCPRPTRYSPEWVDHLKADRGALIKSMKRSSLFQGLAGYQWQLMCSPVLGWYVHWWFFFTERMMGPPEHMSLAIGKEWREQASLADGVSMHATSRSAMLELALSSEARCLARWQTLLECQAGIDYYLQLASDQMVDATQREEIKTLIEKKERKRPAHVKTLGMGVLKRR
jgi:hypothetical protein